MSEPIATEKRTRSQLTLPDDILQLSQRSPLKDARTALRNNTSIPVESTPHMYTRSTGATDDELLLISRTPNTHISTKRSASPLRDEYPSCPDSPPEGRELKRARRDLDAEGDFPLRIAPHITPSNHIRSHSQPSIRLGQKVKGNSTAAPLSRKPASSSNTRSPTTIILRGKARAQSVPLFPPAPAVPHLDLRNPPPSPVRVRSRSPSKGWEPEISVVSGADAVAELYSKEGSSIIFDGAEPQNTFSSLVLRPPTSPTADKTVLLPSALKAVIETSPSVQLPDKPPSTPPPAERLLSTHFWSPLTPLPETPYLPKFSSDMEGRYTGTGWGTDLGEGREERKITTNQIVQEPGYAELDTDDEGCLAHPPNSSTGTFSTTMVPPASPATDVKGLTSVKTTLTQSGRSSGLIKPLLATAKRSAEAQGDAFAIIMAQARLDKGGDKSKGMGKERGTHKKAPSSSTRILHSATIKGKGQATSKELEKEGKTKPSLKAKMRPKQLPKAKPVPVPTQDESENTSTPPNIPPLEMPAFFSNSPAVPIPQDSTNSDPRYLPVKIIHRSSLSPSGVPHLQPHVAGPKDVENSPIATIPAGEGADTVTCPEYPPQPHVTSNPVPTTTTITTSKLPRAKRVPSSTITERVTTTRRVSSRLKGKNATMTNTVAHGVTTTTQAMNSKKITHFVSKLKSLPSEPKAPQDATPSTSSLSDVPSDGIPDKVILPGSPMKIGSPVRKDVQEYPFIQPGFSTTAKAALSRTPSKPKAKSKSESPSPSKLSRSTSMFSVRPTALSRTFTSYGGHSGQSSLSTLSNALEKLRMPPPARPNTSMGFNRDPGNIDAMATSLVQDAVDLSPRKDTGQMVQQNIAFEPGTLRSSSMGQSVKVKNVGPSLKPVPVLNRASSTARLQSGTGPVMRSIGSGNVHGSRSLFGTGGRLFGVPGRAGALQKVSRKTSLPSVMASPVKGSHAPDSTSSNGDEVEGVFVSQSGLDQGTCTDQVAVVETRGDNERERYIDTQRNLASRRASLASQALSQSLGFLPLVGERATGVGLMGPPATSPGRKGTRSASSSYPPSVNFSSGKASDNEVILSARSAVRSAPGAHGKIRGGVDDHLSSGRKQQDDAGAATSNKVSEPLKVLQDCVIFVDVRTDDGDEAGSLFVEMLESVGARILTRVGQTCTHIVYKNGLVSTSTRYRLLREPKPLVVGIAWVVECVEQRQRVDESKFAIDLNNVNVAGVNKRRRSMLPKAIVRDVEDTIANNDHEGDGDQSIEGSSSSMIMDNDLTPLEKARRRKGVL